jgi:hypothetical protein
MVFFRFLIKLSSIVLKTNSLLMFPGPQDKNTSRRDWATPGNRRAGME